MYVCMCLLKKCILSFKWLKDGVHTFDINRWHINIAIVWMHHSSTCGMDVTMLLTVLMIHIIHTCVQYNTYGPYCQMGANCTYGACGTYGAYGTCGTCGTFGAYGACGTCVTYVNEKCRTFFANVVCGTYVTHVPYLQMVRISMDPPNEYKHVFTNGSKNKIMSTPND